MLFQSSKYLEPLALFQGELVENLAKIDDILDIFIYFKYYQNAYAPTRMVENIIVLKCFTDINLSLSRKNISKNNLTRYCRKIFYRVITSRVIGTFTGAFYLKRSTHTKID